MNLTDKEKFVSEMALRIVLRELLQKDQLMIDTVTASSHNLAVGCFGDKEFKPDNPEDWIQFLQPMRDLIDKLDPDYRKSCDELGDSHYKLPEEDK